LREAAVYLSETRGDALHMHLAAGSSLIRHPAWSTLSAERESVRLYDPNCAPSLVVHGRIRQPDAWWCTREADCVGARSASADTVEIDTGVAPRRAFRAVPPLLSQGRLFETFSLPWVRNITRISRRTGRNCRPVKTPTRSRIPGSGCEREAIESTTQIATGVRLADPDRDFFSAGEWLPACVPTTPFCAMGVCTHLAHVSQRKRRLLGTDTGRGYEHDSRLVVVRGQRSAKYE
jgi:hypothetical protein